MPELQQCPHCQAANDPAQRYCGSCGRPLALVCANCGETNPIGFKFCGVCGTELGRDSHVDGLPPEERRVVTVLFADLVGFTARAEKLDPEDVQAILSPYYTRLRNEIEVFGGTVEKFIGDAVMAVFGAPISHGDDPERAVRAALAVQEAVREMNEGNADLDLQVRMAVNTGEALVSLRAKASEGEGLVAGDVVNTASRLQQAAPVGGVIVGEETHRATRGLIQYQDAEPVVAKGKSAPLLAWLAVAAAFQPGVRATNRVPLTGRGHELAFLRDVWRRVVAERRTHLLSVFGPAGVGKTRLATELALLAEAEGARTVGGRAIPYGRHSAYGAFGQQIKQLAEIFDSDSPETAAEKLQRAVTEILPGAEDARDHLAMLVGLGHSEDVADRQILFFTARQLVEALARERPTILLFEDIHWADGGMLDLLELLASRVQDVPLLLLTLARPDLLETRPGWGGGLPAYTALALEPLREEDATELAAHLLEESDAAEDYAAQLAEASEGNPLFIEELAASLAERATLVGELPTNIRGVVSARLDILPPSERAALLDASVVGKVFWRGAIAEMSGDRDRVSELLDSLEGRDFIRRETPSRIQGDQQFVFKHRLIRDVAYATLPRALRRERHAAVAEFLERATGEMADTAAALAHHWREAGNDERAVHYLLVAADQAGRGWAKKHAVALYNEALTLVPEGETEKRREINRLRAIAATALYHVPDAESIGRQREVKPS